MIERKRAFISLICLTGLPIQRQLFKVRRYMDVQYVKALTCVVICECWGALTWTSPYEVMSQRWRWSKQSEIVSLTVYVVIIIFIFYLANLENYINERVLVLGSLLFELKGWQTTGVNFRCNAVALRNVYFKKNTLTPGLKIAEYSVLSI